MFFYSNNRSVIKTHGVLCHIMAAITYFWLIPKTYSVKVPVLTKNKLMLVSIFFSICAFLDINFIIIQQLYLT